MCPSNLPEPDLVEEAASIPPQVVVSEVDAGRNEVGDDGDGQAAESQDAAALDNSLVNFEELLGDSSDDDLF